VGGDTITLAGAMARIAAAVLDMRVEARGAASLPRCGPPHEGGIGLRPPPSRARCDKLAPFFSCALKSLPR